MTGLEAISLKMFVETVTQSAACFADVCFSTIRYAEIYVKRSVIVAVRLDPKIVFAL